MGAFNAKENVCLSDLGTATVEQNEILKCRKSTTNAVSEAITKCGPTAPECYKPHGLEMTVDLVRTEMVEENENSSHGKDFELVKRAGYSTEYTPTDYRCDKSLNTLNIDKMQAASVNEKLNCSQSAEESAKKNILNNLTISEIFAEEYNSKPNVIFHEKVIKKKSIDNNMVEEQFRYSRGKAVWSESKSALAQKCDWIQNPASVLNTEMKVKIKEESNCHCKELKQERITENAEVTECKKPLKWLRNPFSAIAAVTRSYGLLMTGRHDDLTDLHVNDAEIKQENLQHATENICLDEIKQEKTYDNKSCSDTDCLSDFYSLHNTSFESVAKSEPAVEPLFNVNNEKPHWMVKLPEYAGKPIEAVVKQTNTSLKKTKKLYLKDKTAAKRKNRKATLNKGAASKRKVKPKGKKQFKRSKRLRKRAIKDRAKPIKSKRGRKFEADKTYICPVKLLAAENCRVLRARSNEYLKYKHNNCFPKPLVEQKPEIAVSPAPIQINTVKRDLDINCNEISVYEDMQLTNYSEELTKLQKAIKRENKYENCLSSKSHRNGQPIVCLNEMKWNFNSNTNSIKQEHTTSLPPLIQGPKVRVKRLPLPQIVDNVKKFKIIKPEVLTTTSLVTQAHSKCLSTQIEKESTPKIPTETLFSIDLQENTKLLQAMQPRVCLQRLSMPKTANPLPLVNTLNIKHECTSKLFETQLHNIMNIPNNCKLLSALQPKVRLKRLNFSATPTNVKFNEKSRPKLNSVNQSHNLQPVVRLQRLKLTDFKLRENITYEKVENHTQQLNVDLEVKRERACYDTKSAYELRKRNIHNVACIKAEKLSPERSSKEPLTSTPKMRIRNAFSMQPTVRLKRLKCSPMSASDAKHHIFALETPVKMEMLDVDEEQLTPISFAKQYDEQDSGISVDTSHFARDASVSGSSAASCSAVRADELSEHDIVFEIALQRACINDILLRHGYSPIQFRLYNNLEDLKIFLDYLLVK